MLKNVSKECHTQILWRPHQLTEGWIFCLCMPTVWQLTLLCQAYFTSKFPHWLWKVAIGWHVCLADFLFASFHDSLRWRYNYSYRIPTDIAQPFWSLWPKKHAALVVLMPKHCSANHKSMHWCSITCQDKLLCLWKEDAEIIFHLYYLYLLSTPYAAALHIFSPWIEHLSFWILAMRSSSFAIVRSQCVFFVIQGWFNASLAVSRLLGSLLNRHSMKSFALSLLSDQAWLLGNPKWPLSIDSKISLSVKPLNGGCPHNKIYTMIPTDQTSQDLSYLPLSSSGDM